MFDAKKLLDQFIGAAEQVAGKENVDRLRAGIEKNPGLAKAAGVGMAAVLLGTKTGRSLGKSALKLGGVAAVGGLAYKAYQQWQQGQLGGGTQAGTAGELAPPRADTGFAPGAGEENEHAKAFLTAMIAAAKADGNIDAAEQKRIFGKLNEMVEGAEAKAFLMEEMMAPLDIDRVVGLAKTKEMAVELYAASLIAIDPDHPSEKLYLADLADRLGIDKGLAELLQKAVDEERASA